MNSGLPLGKGFGWVFIVEKMSNPVSPESLARLDAQHHLHPFTNHEDMHATGTHVMVRGEGVYVWDARGQKLLDGLAGLWCVNVGYNCAEIIDAVNDQMHRLPYYCSFFNTTTEPAIELADKIASLTPRGLGHVMFTNSGSEANETALKLIRGYLKLRGQSVKSKILTRNFSYHGVTLATTSMTGLPSCTAPFDLPLPGFVQIPGPNAYAADKENEPDAYGRWCLEETERIIVREDPGTIAAIFAEPIQGAGGVIVPPAGYLRALRDLARKYDILFVADEVITGFGRLGSWFGSELWNLEPDILVLAKGLTSGYLPLGATVVQEEIAEVLIHGGYLAHGFTYSGHPTTCAAGLANLRVIERDKLVEHVRDDVGPYFQDKLRGYAGHPLIGEVRGHGLIGALELLPPDRDKAKLKGALGAKAAALARKEGVIVRGIRDLIAVSPPLIITRLQIDELFAGVDRTLAKMAE
ncbi:MAG TPA: aminotransferase [Chthoniobacter sp.]|nr:aminotransferase [Chthoniobacter sp.]